MSYIREVIEHYGLKIEGQKCVCPFHEDTRPSCHIYDDTESVYCFSCGTGGDAIHIITKMERVGFKRAVGIYREITGDEESFVLEEDSEHLEDIVGKEFNEEIHNILKRNTGIDSKKYRGIRSDISKPFGIRYEYNPENGEVSTIYYPTTIGYELSGYKIRKHPKTFVEPYGETGKGCDLFGQFKFKTHNHTLLITGGEHDVLAAFQMLSDNQRNKQFDPVAVVSATIGEAGAWRQIQAQYEWVNRFKKIVLAFDNDKAGREATKSALEVLPPGKTFIMDMRLSDPNEYLMQGRENEFISDFWGAKLYTPDGIKSPLEAFDGVEEELLKEVIPLPPYMHKMSAMMGGGIKQGRIANVIAYTSSGKSSHVNRMVYHAIFNSPVIPTIISLEATAAQYVLELMSIHLHSNLLWKMTGEEILEFLGTEEGKKAKRELCFKETGEPRFYLIDERSGNIKSLEEQIEVMFKKHNSKLFIIDVLSDVLRGSSEQYAEDHLLFQRNLNKSGVTFLNVLHTRKPPQPKDGVEPKATEFDALGTGSFVQSAAYNIVLNRNKMSEDNIVKNTTEVDLPKCRGGLTGEAGKWYYDFMTAQCYDLDDWLAENPDKVVGF